MLAASFFALSAQAEKLVLTCKFPALEKKSFLYVTVKASENRLTPTYDSDFTDYEGESTPFSYQGEKLEWLWLLMSGGDSGFRNDRDGNLVVSLDSDGCDVGIFKLYQNNGYKFGYLKVEHRCSGRDYPDTYSKAYCSLE